MWLLALLVQRTEQNKQDADLLKRIQRQDQQALALLYDRYAPVLYPLALRIVATGEEAEEILQEVFLQVWEKASIYTPDRGSVYSWIIAMCRNRAIDQLRSKGHKKKSRETGLEESHSVLHTATDSDPHDIVVMKGYAESVRAALKTLSRLEVKILELSYYEGYSQSEIAKMLKMPLGTVKTKMRKGIQKLRQVVGKDEV
jgi:RNA polymerase sigma-70 factor (ECF subfamily)